MSDEVPRTRPGDLFQARASGFAAGVIFSILVGIIAPPVMGILDVLAQEFPGWLIIGLVGTIVLVLVALTWNIPRRKK